MQVVILCGGRGTRAYPYTEHTPKPMLPVCGRPILRHVMNIYASQGHTEFVLALGYRKEVIIDYFQDRTNNWKVELVETGDDTDTGERILRCAEYLDDTFFATYSDGLGNVDLDALLRFHQSHAGQATLTAVPLPTNYGTVEFDADGCISVFREKPVIRDRWINAGFFVFEKSVLRQWKGTNLERDVLPELGRRGLLYAYRHLGFWKSMDSYKDHQDLERILRGDSHICEVSAVPCNGMTVPAE